MLHTSSRSPRTRVTWSPLVWISRPHIASHSGQVRKWVRTASSVLSAAVPMSPSPVVVVASCPARTAQPELSGPSLRCRPWGRSLPRTSLGNSRVPLAICFAAFVITFIVTRVITRMIRAGRGPFKDNVSESGLHIHHAVPGIILLVIGAFIAVGVDPTRRGPSPSALLVGVGTSLVLDEFALILRLDDVYWLEEGRISIEMVSLAIGVPRLVLVGAEPFNFLKDDNGKITIEQRSARPRDRGAVVRRLRVEGQVPAHAVRALRLPGRDRRCCPSRPARDRGGPSGATSRRRWSGPSAGPRARTRAGIRSRPGSATSSPASRRARPPHRGSITRPGRARRPRASEHRPPRMWPNFPARS